MVAMICQNGKTSGVPYIFFLPDSFCSSCKACLCMTFGLSHNACIGVEYIFLFALFGKKSPLGEAFCSSVCVCAVKTSWDSL